MMLFAYILIPLILSNVFHMLVVKWDILPQLAVPLNAKWFGKNKTWRGFVVVPLLNALFMGGMYFLFEDGKLIEGIEAGFSFGLIYMLSELPNSYFKRRAGIPAGEMPDRFSLVVRLADKMDSSLGVTIFAAWLYELGAERSIYLFVLSFVLHAGLSLLLYRIKVKKSV
ncbi:MAG: CDP-archaeol synthase [Bacteroidia bacterium]